MGVEVCGCEAVEVFGNEADGVQVRGGREVLEDEAEKFVREGFEAGEGHDGGGGDDDVIFVRGGLI